MVAPKNFVNRTARAKIDRKQEDENAWCLQSHAWRLPWLTNPLHKGPTLHPADSQAMAAREHSSAQDLLQPSSTLVWVSY